MPTTRRFSTKVELRDEPADVVQILVHLSHRRRATHGGTLRKGCATATVLNMIRVSIPALLLAILVAGCSADDGGREGSAIEKPGSSTDDTGSGAWFGSQPPTTAEPTTTVPALQQITGSFTLIDSDVVGTWDGCFGSGGYDDFGPGMNVTVRDGQGDVVGVGSTESLSEADRTGVWADDVTFSEDSSVSCVVKFTVDVKPAEFYSVEVGSRGDLTYSAAELEAAGWHVELSLG